ncbi:Cytosol aminopeptidase PepA [hydrothermal vent metagenome]|uniref:leucyl aminopeptidase n=1 Tax=hydrothermal vent metagenome TaxID=652676 RepID=A0A3B0W7C9_9ZZZZ
MKPWPLLLLSITLISNLNLATAAKDTPPTEVIFSNQLPTEGNLVLGVYADGQLGQLGIKINQQGQGDLAHAIQITEFAAKINTTQLVTAPKESGLAQILLIGLGEKTAEHTELDWQELGGTAVQAAVEAFKTAPAMAFDVIGSETNAHIAYGAKLGSYHFDKYFTDTERHKHQDKLTVVTGEVKATEKHYRQELEPVANAIWYTRDISNEPPNVIYPASFVAKWKQHFKGMENIKIKVLDEQDMLDKNMGAIYGVGRGSQKPPRMMIVEYTNGNEGDAPVLLVGKGITFDTGGISLKKPTNMWNMKFDMSGAASVMGSLYALAGRGAKVNVVAIAALAENMPGANAQRPGDVVTSMSGKTIQIRSTDAEGRLILADGNFYADTTYNPTLLVNLATLTGSASRATGKDYAAMFSRHDDLAAQFIEMGKKTGDQVWHLPLNDNHFEAIEADIADVMNSGPDAPGASAGAAFLGTFIRETTPWVHLDIAGVAWDDKTTPIKASPGSTSFGIRLLNGYIKAHFETN